AEKAPCTVEMLTPTFSKTRPRMTAMTPPPPSDPSSVGRRHSLRSKRPGERSPSGPVSASSRRSNSAQIWSRNSANQAAARALLSSLGSVIDRLLGKHSGLSQGLTQHHRRRDGNVERALPALQRNHDPGAGRSVDRVGHAARFTAEEEGIAGFEAEERV